MEENDEEESLREASICQARSDEEGDVVTWQEAQTRP